MTEECCVPGGNIMILACSGGSNVGQLANQAAVELTREGFGKMYCLAGVGGLLSGFVQSARDATGMVAIDGCSVGCTKAILKNTNVPLRSYVVVTDLGIKKKHDFVLQEQDTRTVKEAVRKACAQSQPACSGGIVPKSCCGS
jgi:uncharacterized metal-binding protein